MLAVSKKVRASSKQKEASSVDQRVSTTSRWSLACSFWRIMFLPLQSRPIKAAPKLTLIPTPVPYIFSVEETLEEAGMELSSGFRVLDDHLVHRLECLTKDLSLPTPYRARALSLLCRSG